jgi:multidrug efflux system membrane fusion protein
VTSSAFVQLHAQALVTTQQLEQQQALVAEREGALAADRAQVEKPGSSSLIRASRRRSPAGLGLRTVDVGNLVRANEAGGLVVISQTRPISVVFTVPEIDLAKVVEPLRAGEVICRSRPGTAANS